MNKVEDIKSIQIHSSTVESILLMRDGRIITSSYDKTIKVFDPIKNYHCDITMLY